MSFLCLKSFSFLSPGEALQTLDQRFDRLELMYADDQIGDLEDEADDIAGDASLAQFRFVLRPATAPLAR